MTCIELSNVMIIDWVNSFFRCVLRNTLRARRGTVLNLDNGKLVGLVQHEWKLSHAKPEYVIIIDSGEYP